MTRTAEEARGTWIARWWTDGLQDLRLAGRGMRRDVAFTVFVVLIAGLGIGASATVFSVVNALLLRPLPFRDPAPLVWIANDGQNHEEWTTQVGHFVDVRAATASLVDMAGWDNFYHAGDSELTGLGEPERVTSVPVTQNLFPMLGIEPAAGRFFTTAEAIGSVGRPPAVILSHGFWVRRFAADPALIGRTLTLNNAAVTVVGVVPASFEFSSIFTPGLNADIFVPWRHPDRNAIRPIVMPLAARVSGAVRPALMVLAGAVALVMLIVCANLSTLQLARLGARQKELAVRVALGAGRLRLVRQVLTESLALACAGALLGIVFAMLGTRELAHLTALKLPLLDSIGVDLRAVGVTLLITVVTGVLFGVLPAFQVRVIHVGTELKEGTRGSTRGGRAWIRGALVTSEIALACLLLVGTGLLTRSLLRVLDADLGFQPAQVDALRADPSFKITSWEQQNGYLDDVLRRTRGLPGVQAAGFTDELPFAGDRSWQVTGVGQVWPRGRAPEPYIRVVSDGYFEAMGIALREGRLLTPRDRASSEKVVIVNQTLARTLWPGQSAIGQRITLHDTPTVIGVVADVRHQALERDGAPELYLPMRQTSDYADMQLVVRTTLPEDVLGAEIRTALRPIDPNLPVRAFQPLQDLVDRTVSSRRFVVVLLAGFAAFALLLASLGIYVLISQSVAQRTQEIGIRMALGAPAGDVQRRVLRDTLGLVGIGLAIGLVLSRLLATALGSLLLGVTSGDPATFAAIALALIIVAALAGYTPARRAARIDPMVTLRSN